MYNPTVWLDQVDQYENRFYETVNDDGSVTHSKVRGVVMQEGTPQDAAHFNNLETGTYDAHLALALLLNAHRQSEWLDDERIKALEGYVDDHRLTSVVQNLTLTNTLAFPFNNSLKTISIPTMKDTDYLFKVNVRSFDGNIGEIYVIDKQVNGLKIGYTGSAKKVVLDLTLYHD